MSKGVNKTILIGYLGKDPEIRESASGPVANCSLATSESWRDKTTGEKVEKTEWHRVVFFNKQAEIVGQYLRKGSLIYVEGRLQTRKWQDKEGQDRYTTEVVGMTMQMLGGKSASSESPQNDGEYEGYDNEPQQQPRAAAPQGRPAAAPQRSASQQAPQGRPPVQQRQAAAGGGRQAAPPSDFDDSDIPF